MLSTLLIFLIILSILVLVHELGHFLVAKKAGIKVEEFGFGLPPRIWGKKIGETIYSINVLPIGGFVKMYGEEGEVGKREARSEKLERAFYAKSKKVRLAVVAAGVTMNFLLAVGIFSFVYAKLGIPVKTNQVRVVEIAPNSPASVSGLQLDDVIIKAGEEKIDDASKFIQATKKFAGQKMPLEIDRVNNPCKSNVMGATPGLVIACKDGNMLFYVTPRLNPPANEGPLGVAISQIENKFYPWPEQIVRGSIEGFKEAFGWIQLILSGLGTMLSQLVHGSVPKDVAGPIGIFQVTGEVSKGGILSLLQFLGILSVNLAVINILPLPALDGGRVLFIVIETITKRKVNQELETKIHNIGMIVLLTLILLITINDISRILTTFGILSRLRSLLPL